MPEEEQGSAPAEDATPTEQQPADGTAQTQGPRLPDFELELHLRGRDPKDIKTVKPEDVRTKDDG